MPIKQAAAGRDSAGPISAGPISAASASTPAHLHGPQGLFAHLDGAGGTGGAGGGGAEAVGA